MPLACALVLVNLVLCIILLCNILRPHPLRRQGRDRMATLRERWKRQRHLHPKSAADCALCGREHTSSGSVRPVPPPYAQTKSRRGRKKRLNSEGKACLQPDCQYFMVTEAAIHTLIGDGQRGRKHNIQHWYCQHCGHSYTTRRGTMLYQLKTPAEMVEMALKLLCLGVTAAPHTKFSL